MPSESPARVPRADTHVPELDGVRGIAIAAVMALHFLCTPISAPSTLAERVIVRITGYGVWGVDLFFVLSGYLITGILADSRGSPRYFRTFYMRRTLRIFPLYYGVLLLATVLIPAAVLARFAPHALEIRAVQGWLWPYLTNVYLVSRGGFTLPYFSHFWTLAIEEHFYLAWPFIVGYARRETAMRACVVLGSFALISRIVLQFSGHAFAAQVLTPCRLDTLTIGAWFALAARGPGGVDALGAKTRRWIGPLAVAVVVTSAVHAARTSADALVEPIRLTVLAAFFGAFILLSAWKQGPPSVRAALARPWLRWLGKYSYGLYVYHGIIAYVLLHDGLLAKIERAAGSRLLGVLAGAAAGSAVSIALSLASYELFESKFLRLKRMFEAKRAPVAS